MLSIYTSIHRYLMIIDISIILLIDLYFFPISISRYISPITSLNIINDLQMMKSDMDFDASYNTQIPCYVCNHFLQLDRTLLPTVWASLFNKNIQKQNVKHILNISYCAPRFIFIFSSKHYMGCSVPGGLPNKIPTRKKKPMNIWT